MKRLGAAALVIVSVLGAAGIAIDTLTRERLLRREAMVAQEFLENIVAVENVGPEAFAAGAAPAAISGFAAHVGALRGILRANIYAPDGFIRYSTEPNLIGIKFHENEDLAEAAAGRLIVHLEADGDDKAEQIGLTNQRGESLIEGYVPVRDPQGAVIAVVEYYRRTSDFDAAVAAERKSIAAALSAAALVLIAAAGLYLRKPA